MRRRGFVIALAALWNCGVCHEGTRCKTRGQSAQMSEARQQSRR
jgi:hypothetical protein